MNWPARMVNSPPIRLGDVVGVPKWEMSAWGTSGGISGGLWIDLSNWEDRADGWRLTDGDLPAFFASEDFSGPPPAPQLGLADNPGLGPKTLAAILEVFEQLHGLDLGDCKGVTDQSITPLAMAAQDGKLPALQRLGLGECKGDDAPMPEAHNFRIDDATKKVHYKGFTLPMRGGKPYQLLQCLNQHPGWVYSYEQILRAVWKKDRSTQDAGIRAQDNMISKQKGLLMKKLRPCFGDLIEIETGTKCYKLVLK